MDADGLACVLQIAEAKSLSGAARRMRVDVSTISRRLKGLEAELGAPLFISTGRGQVPTDAGRLAIGAAREVASRIEVMTEQVRRLDGSITSLVRVTAPPATVRCGLLEGVALMRRRHSGLRVQLLLTADTLSLSGREADVALRISRQPPPSSLFGRRIAPVRYAIYGAREDLGTSDENGTACIAWLGAEQPPEPIRSRFPAARVSLEVSHLEAMIEAVHLGMGIALLPRAIGARDPELRHIEDDPTDYGLHLWALTHPQLREDPVVRSILNDLAGALSPAFQDA